MSFSFGNTATNAFGTPAKPTAFGAPISFGTPTTSAPAAGFGFGSTFGATAPTQQQAPAFGSTFGTPASGAAPAFGSTFGTTATAAPAFGTTFGATSTAPAFGTTFGTPATSAPAFGTTFGAAATATTPSLFGATPTAKPSLFSTANTPNLFSSPATTSSLFGQQPGTTQTPSLFGTTTTPSLFGANPTATPSLFGAQQATPTFFGNPTATTGAFSLFGNTATTTSATLFGGFGTNTGTTTFSGFGAGSTGFGLKPATQQQFQQQGPDIKNQQVLASFYAINVFGDERDDILKKWNMLQACWGTGKAFYNSSQAPVDYDLCNPFYRFKGICYTRIPNMEDTDGLVKLIFNKKESEIQAQKSVILNGLNGILGNKPNLTVSIIHVKGLSDTETELVITVAEKGVTGSSRKILATELSGFLNQPVQKQQLSTAGVNLIAPYVVLTKAQIEEYLKEPSPGIDEQMWRAAQIDNPDPQKYLPAPLTGFANLKKRVKCSEHETGLHRSFLKKVEGEILDLKKKHAASIAQIAEQKQKFVQLQHRVLRILVKQEVTRKVGLALQPEEEVIKTRLENIYAQLNTPSQFRGTINELNSSLKLCDTLNIDLSNNELYKIDDKVQNDMKQFLKMQQEGITHLVNVMNNDLRDLKIVAEGMSQLVQTK